MKEFIKQFDEKFLNSYLKQSYIKNLPHKTIVNNHKDYILKISDLRQYNSLTYWNDLFKHVSDKNLQGDIIECGVGDGQSLSYILFNLITSNKLVGKKYYGFDSFEGFPTIGEYDYSTRNPKKGEWNHTSEEFVKENLIDLGFKIKDFKNIFFIKGFFEDSFEIKLNEIDKIALLHIDCDLYSSTKLSLESWYDKVEPNGVIVFDEYLNSINQFPGAVKAIDEFLGIERKNIQLSPISNQYYLIKK